jgi:hypothetical protein
MEQRFCTCNPVYLLLRAPEENLFPRLAARWIIFNQSPPMAISSQAATDKRSTGWQTFFPKCGNVITDTRATLTGLEGCNYEFSMKKGDKSN